MYKIIKINNKRSSQHKIKICNKSNKRTLQHLIKINKKFRKITFQRVIKIIKHYLNYKKFYIKEEKNYNKIQTNMIITNYQDTISLNFFYKKI